MSLAILDRLTHLGILLDRTKEGAVSADYFARLRVKAASVDAPVNSLSGGNQQKIIFVKWLARGGRLLIVDEPARVIVLREGRIAGEIPRASATQDPVLRLMAEVIANWA